MIDLIRHYAHQFHLDPDDLHQDIQLKLLLKSNLYSVHENASYRTWLSHMVRNHCIDHTRKQSSKMLMVDIKNARRSHSPASKFDNRQLIARMFILLRTTWPNQRRRNTRILWMLMTGYKYEEIGEEMKIPLGSTKAIIHRIRTLLWEHFPR